MLANVGAGTIADVSAKTGADFQAPAWNRGAAFGDLDGDGRVDVVVSRIGERAAIFRNTSATGNHYLASGFAARRSNRDGLGAMVVVTGSSGRRQWNRATTAAGYGSSSERTVFFGMGSGQDGDIGRSDVAGRAHARRRRMPPATAIWI